MTSQHQPTDPPRRPLRVLRGETPIVVQPGTADYEGEYRLAARLHEEGVPMPYADEVGEADDERQLERGGGVN